MKKPIFTIFIFLAVAFFATTANAQEKTVVVSQSYFESSVKAFNEIIESRATIKELIDARNTVDAKYIQAQKDLIDSKNEAIASRDGETKALRQMIELMKAQSRCDETSLLKIGFIKLLNFKKCH